MICTSIKQSKKLMELGINIETADMYYYTVNGDLYKTPNIIESEDDLYVDEKSIPAWSLSALLKLIPPYLGEFSEGIDFGFGKAMNGKWYSAHYLQYTKEDVKPVKTVTGDTAVDAAFEMVVWLKENKKI